jgi:hypothetical protein
MEFIRVAKGNGARCIYVYDQIVLAVGSRRAENIFTESNLAICSIERSLLGRGVISVDSEGCVFANAAI